MTTTPQPPSQALPLSAEELQQYITVLGADCYEVEKYLQIKPRCVVEIDMLKRCHAALVARDEELAKVREALRPFGVLLQKFHDRKSDDDPIFGLNGNNITVGDLRRAASTHSKEAK